MQAGSFLLGMIALVASSLQADQRPRRATSGNRSRSCTGTPAKRPV